MTPLAWAAHFGRLSAAKCLLDHGANIEATCGVRCWRPLHFASYYCHPAGTWCFTPHFNSLIISSQQQLTQHILSVVRILVQRGAETRAKDTNGMPPGRTYNFRCFLPFIGPSAKDRRGTRYILFNSLSFLDTVIYFRSTDHMSPAHPTHLTSNAFPFPT